MTIDGGTGLTLAAAYFLIVGVVGLVLPLLGLGPSDAEFEAKSVAYKLGAYLRESFINLAFIISGVSILAHQFWAPYLAYLALAVGTFYTPHQLAWGFAGGRPSRAVTVGSFLSVGAWNGFWAYVVFSNRAAL
jgi:hypothetical protein